MKDNEIVVYMPKDCPGSRVSNVGLAMEWNGIVYCSDSCVFCPDRCNLKGVIE